MAQRRSRATPSQNKVALAKERMRLKNQAILEDLERRRAQRRGSDLPFPGVDEKFEGQPVNALPRNILPDKLVTPEIERVRTVMVAPGTRSEPSQMPLRVWGTYSPPRRHEITDPELGVLGTRLPGQIKMKSGPGPTGGKAKLLGHETGHALADSRFLQRGKAPFSLPEESFGEFKEEWADIHRDYREENEEFSPFREMMGQPAWSMYNELYKNNPDHALADSIGSFMTRGAEMQQSNPRMYNFIRKLFGFEYSRESMLRQFERGEGPWTEYD
jgi:hypothetical protein